MTEILYRLTLENNFIVLRDAGDPQYTTTIGDFSLAMLDKHGELVVTMKQGPTYTRRFKGVSVDKHVPRLCNNLFTMCNATFFTVMERTCINIVQHVRTSDRIVREHYLVNRPPGSSVPPEGEDVVIIYLQNADIALNGEPLAMKEIADSYTSTQLIPTTQVRHTVEIEFDLK